LQSRARENPISTSREELQLARQALLTENGEENGKTYIRASNPFSARYNATGNSDI
jgi:uncharacterized membrane protein